MLCFTLSLSRSSTTSTTSWVSFPSIVGEPALTLQASEGIAATLPCRTCFGKFRDDCVRGEAGPCDRCRAKRWGGQQVHPHSAIVARRCEEGGAPLPPRQWRGYTKDDPPPREGVTRKTQSQKHKCCEGKVGSEAWLILQVVFSLSGITTTSQ